MICVGFDGSSAASAPLDALRAFGPGAVILFGRNAAPADRLRGLIGALRGLGDPPPLIAVDQEGGRVERFHDGVAALPSAMAFGAAGDVDLAARAAMLLGRDLARLGVTADLAPVADLSLQPRSRVIGTRAFGDDPQRVAALSAAFAAGLERAGVAAAFKHFPGHGSTAADSHVALPRVAADRATLRARDLVPFAHGIAAGVASLIVSAHVVVEAFDAERPATLSRAILTELLRGELGFAGVVATDCLEMDAIARGTGTVQGAVEALVAGADLLLISHHLELAHQAADAIVDAIESGRLPEDRLREAHARVAHLRRRFASPATPIGDADENAPLEAAQRAPTRIAGDPRLRTGKPVTVISFEGVAGDNAAASGAGRAVEPPSLSAALRRRGWKSELMRVALEPAAEDLELLLEHVPALGEREFVVVTRDAHVAPPQRAAVARILAAAPEAVIVSARSPYDVCEWPQARRVLCTYGDGAIAFEGCADVLSGRAPLRGSLPVHVDGVAVR